MEQYAWHIVVGLITALGGINAFFIARLVKKIDESSAAVISFKADLENIKEKIGELSDLSHRIVELEKKLAVLEYRAGHQGFKEEG